MTKFEASLLTEKIDNLANAYNLLVKEDVINTTACLVLLNERTKLMKELDVYMDIKFNHAKKA